MYRVLFILFLFIWGCGKSSIKDFSCEAQSCNEGIECGVISDGCGEILECGECEGDKVCQGYKCVVPGTACQPKSCRELNAVCGEISDGCGQKLNCGQCETGKICQANACIVDHLCVPKSCKDLGAQCGDVSDGCGGILSCGVCESSKVCNSEHYCVLASECVAKSCEALNAQCGNVSDGCGGTLDCGSCGSGKVCDAQNQCVSSCVPKTCQSLGVDCGTTSDGCGGTLDCGNCRFGVCKSHGCQVSQLAYPTRRTIKGLTPDGWNESEILAQEVGGVSIGLKWSDWQPSLESTCGSGFESYDGYCFKVQGDIARQIKRYSDAGVVVTAMLYGTPSWASENCVGDRLPEGYCAPSASGKPHFARFAGFIAHYFNGESGHGRVSDFVIYKDANTNPWYNTGCTDQKSVNRCEIESWTSHYAETYNLAYDAIKREQLYAKVLFGVEWSFDRSFDSAITLVFMPLMSSMSFIEHLVPKLGNREWHVACQVFPKGPEHLHISANDWPVVSFGNIGILVSWLKRKYPGRADNLSIQIVEGGISSATGDLNAHSQVLCQSYYNVLGTPGIDSFNYFHMIDNPSKDYSLSLGLVDSSRKFKPAWFRFSSINKPSSLGCGFENLPYTLLSRYYSSKYNLHWATTRMIPEDSYGREGGCFLHREHVTGTVALYECRIGGPLGYNTMITKDINCRGHFNMGPVGYIFTQGGYGRVALYLCRRPNPESYFFSDNAECEKQEKVEDLGYAPKC